VGCVVSVLERAWTGFRVFRRKPVGGFQSPHIMFAKVAKPRQPSPAERIKFT
jgi:hypothetical protein